MATRRCRIESIYYSRTQEASNDIDRAPDGFLIVVPDGDLGVTEIVCSGITTRAEANRTRKRITNRRKKYPKYRGQKLMLMHKMVKHPEEPVGWVVGG